MTSIERNLSEIQKKIHAACARVGRDPSEVKLIGVTKMVPPERVREGILAGVTHIGENYVQEARKKMAVLENLPVTWHFIGHLQSNKAKFALDLFDIIHTVDRVSLAKELNRQAEKKNKHMRVLLQVNIGDEASKSGVSSGDLLPLFKVVESMDRLIVCGLMILPPFLDDPEKVRPYFRRCRELLESMRDKAAEPNRLTELSMGMSHDFAVAVEEGATMVRVGTALFGARPT